MKKIKKNNFYLIYFIIFLLFFILFSFFDLQISFFFSQLLPGEYYSNNIFVVLVELFGEFFLYFFSSFAVSIFYFCQKNKLNKPIKILIKIFLFILICFIWFLFFLRLIKNINHHVAVDFSIWLFGLGAVGAIGVALLFLGCVKKLGQNKIDQLVQFAFFTFVVVIPVCFVVQFLKGDVWGRMRFCAMNFVGDFSGFTPWWQFGKIPESASLLFQDLQGDAFRSFPSGHSATASLVFLFLILPKFLDAPKVRRRAVLHKAFALVFVALVGLGRIMAGAHFLSDVVFGILITTSLIFIISRLFLTKKNINTILN